MKNKKKVITGIIILLAILLFGSNLIKKHKTKKGNEIELSKNNIMADKSNKQKQEDVLFTPIIEQEDKRDDEKTVVNKSNEENTEYYKNKFDPDIDFKSNFSIHESYEGNENGENINKQSNNFSKKDFTSFNNGKHTDNLSSNNIGLNNQNNKDNFIKNTITNNTVKKSILEEINLYQNCLNALDSLYNLHNYKTDGYHSDSWYQENWSKAYVEYNKELNDLCNKIDSYTDDKIDDKKEKFKNFKNAINKYKNLYNDAVKINSDNLITSVNQSNVEKCKEILQKYKFGEYIVGDKDVMKIEY